MDFSNDGKSFAAAGLDKVIRIWNVSDLTTTAHLTPPRQIHLWNGTGTAGLIYSVDFSPDDRLLGVATNFGGFLISPETGDIVASLTIPTIAERLLNFHSMAFSPDGKWMATGHNKSLRFWHLESVRTQVESGPLPSEVASQISNQLKGRHQVLRAHDLMPETGVMSVSFCQDSNGALFALSAAGDTTPIVWEESNGVWRKSYTLTCEGPTYTAKFLGIPSRVVTASENRTVAYWDHRKRLTTRDMHASEVFRNSIICEVPGIETVVIGNWPGMGKCSVRTGRDGDDEVCNFRLHDDTVTALACHPTEKLVASAGSRSSRICFWNPTNAQLYASIDCASSSVYSVGFAADGKSIAFGRAAYTAPNEFSPSRARAFLSAHNWSDYPFMWGSLRANKYANPLERGFSLEKMTPDEGVGFSDADLEESGWHRELLKLNEWEVDKYASPRGQPVDQNKDQIIVMRSGREVTRFHCPNSLPANTCTLTRIDGTNKAALIVAYGGARVGMFDIETHRLLCEFTGCQSDATSLAVSPDFQYLVAGGHDHVIRIWSLRQPAKPDTAAARSEPQQVPPLLSILATDSGQWVAWTENGFYTCSPGADDLFGWQVNHGVNKLAEFHPAESFKAALYRPDLVKTILNSHGDPNVIPERLTVQQLLASSRPPIVQITKPHHLEVISRKELDLQALISHPPELPIQAVEVVVNGKSTRALSVVPTLTDGKRYAETVTLTRGVNNISVRAFGPGGIVSAPQLVTVTCTASDATTLESGELPSLYLLAIGVSEHQNSQLNLDYAAKDALDMAALWESQKGKRFQSVRAKTLVNEQATSVNVLSALRDLQDAGAGIHDFAMIFVSGHGIQDVDGEYRFVTADADLQETENTTVHWDAFQKTLRRLPSHNILLLDTCHAGAAVGHESIDDRSTDAYNNILRNAASADSGYITFASCLPHEKSLENPEWKNGAFTLSIVEGFSGKADTNRDRTISISEIETYASQRVEVLSRGQQRTALFKSITIPSNLVLVQF